MWDNLTGDALAESLTVESLNENLARLTRENQKYKLVNYVGEPFRWSLIKMLSDSQNTLFVKAILEAFTNNDYKIKILCEPLGGAFFRAAQKGNTQMCVEILNCLENIEDKIKVINHVTLCGDSALIVAASYGHTETCRAIIELIPEEHRSRLFVPVEGIQGTIIEAAFHAGALELVSLLRAYGAILPQYLQRLIENPENNTLVNMAHNRENAMIALSESQQGLVACLERDYGKKINQFGVLHTLAELKNFLIQKYIKGPVLYRKKPLPFDLSNEGIGKLKNKTKLQFYNHIYHTAYRYLFLHPNPWIDPNADYTYQHDDGGVSAHISEENVRKVALFWMAASDETIEPINGFTLISMQEHFIKQLYYMGRAHNMGDDIAYQFNGDRPTCNQGIGQQLMRSIIGHPLMEHPQARPLDANLFMEKVKQELIVVAFESFLASLNLKQCEALQKAAENQFVTYIDNNDYQAQLLGRFNINQVLIDNFISGCYKVYAKERIIKYSVKFQGVTYQNYINLLNHFADNPWVTFFDTLNTLLNTHIERLKVSQRESTNISPQLLNQFANMACNDNEQENQERNIKPSLKKHGMGKVFPE